MGFRAASSMMTVDVWGPERASLPLTLMLLLSAAPAPSAYATPPPCERLEYLVASSGNYRLNSTCAF